jgi:hypothetical protein
MSVSDSSGYPKLASFMVREGYGIYRQFQELACQDLLYRQSELVHLERELQIIAKHDREAGRDTEEKQYSLDWRKLSTSAKRNSPSKQWMKALEVREKLQEYCEFCLYREPCFELTNPQIPHFFSTSKYSVNRILGRRMSSCCETGFLGRRSEVAASSLVWILALIIAVFTTTSYRRI